MVMIRPTGKTSDERQARKARNEMRQARTHTWALNTSPKLKSLQYLTIRVNPEVTEEVMHHAGLRVDGGLHLCLHECKVIHPMLESPDPFHRALSLVNPITDVPLQMSIPVRVPGRGRGFGSEARLRVTVRGVITITLMVTRVATPIPSVPLGLLRVSPRCRRGLLCCLHASSLWVRCRPVKLWRGSPIQSNCSVRFLQEYCRRPGLGNRITLRPYNIDKEWSGFSHKMCAWTKWSRPRTGTSPSM
jgi:hypothetical protein